MIPLTLVTGFLGSGKTTLLQHLACHHGDRKVVWVVNEFSVRDMDAARLASVSSDVVSVTGGSIFCRCKATEYLDLLRSLPARFDPEAVVIEASGMADPTVAGKMLGECGLDHQYQIAAVVAVVDPGSFLKLLHTLPNIRAQIESATRVLVNKTDLYSLERIEETESAVRAIHPLVPMTRTQHCAADCNLFETGQTVPLAGELAPCVDPRFVQFVVPLPDEVDLERLEAAVTPASDAIYRIKGLARSAGRSYELDFSLSGWRIVETRSDAQPSLVLIARGPCSDAVARLLQQLRGA
jgi:G3E family GTPase